MTQADIASRMGTSQGQIIRFESGADARLSTVARYAAALGVRVEWTITPKPRTKKSVTANRGQVAAKPLTPAGVAPSPQRLSWRGCSRPRVALQFDSGYWSPCRAEPAPTEPDATSGDTVLRFDPEDASSAVGPVRGNRLHRRVS